jgi:hypothetical protein
MKSFNILYILCLLFLLPVTCYSGSVDVSGYTDKGVYVYGELDVNPDGSVEGYVYTPRGKSLYVEGEIERGGTVEIEHDDSGGGGYELDID